MERRQSQGTESRRRDASALSILLLASIFIVIHPTAQAQTINHRSIGTNAANLVAGGDVSALLSSTTITFNGVLLPANVGLGDRLHIDQGGARDEILFILSRDSATQVTVQTPTQYQHTNDGFTLTRAYNTLQAWEDPCGAVPCLFDSLGGRGGDLVAEDRQEVGVVYNDSPFNIGAAIQGSTTDATHFMKLTVARGQRHNGTAGTGAIIDGLDNSAGEIVIEDDFTVIEWLEVMRVRGPSWVAGVRVRDGNNILLSHLLVHDSENGIRIGGTASSSFTARNCIVYSCDSFGIEGGGATDTAEVENCTIYSNAAHGVEVGSSAFNVVNTIAIGNLSGDFQFGSSTHDYNMSSDGSATGPNSIIGASAVNEFKSLGPIDLHLNPSAQAIDRGFPGVPTDIDAQKRPAGAQWDMGADEYRALATNLRSIGLASPSSVGSVTAVDGSTLVEGAGTFWKTDNWGRGDRIWIDGMDYPVRYVESDTRLFLATPFSGITGAGKAYTISRQFSTLQGWENCISGNPPSCTFFPGSVTSADLILDDRSEIGIVYNDDFLNPGVVIDGSTTDAFHTIQLTADDGNRHLGVSNPNAAVIDLLSASAVAVDVQDEFVTVEWLEIRGVGGAAHGVQVNNVGAANRIVLRDLLIHHVGGDGINLTSDAEVRAFNNIIYEAGVGINIVPSVPTATMGIFNNTIYSCNGGGGPTGVRATAAGDYATVTLRNNLLHSNSGGDFSNPFVNVSGSNNLSGDNSVIALGIGTLGNVLLGDVRFISTSPGSEDLHIQAGSTAADGASNLDSIFVHDIDAKVRVVPWDIGADDIDAAATSVELRTFEATGLDGEVLLTWETASEIDNLGFYLYRSESEEGPYVRLNPIAIPGLGSSPVGAKYRYRDQGVVNGRTYYYELEDFEASGRRERHGPVWARPDVGLPSEVRPGGGEGSGESSSSITVGKTGSTLREVGRGRGYVELELVTHGFTALPLADGSTALSVEGFSEEWEAGRPAVPVKRVWIEALAGKEVRIGSVRASDVTSFSLRPASAEAPAILVDSGGTVRAGRKPRQSRRTRLRQGYGAQDRTESTYPSASARVVSVGFDGDEKKALLELAPMQWNASTGQLLLAESLWVRVEFDGAVAYERSLGGSRGRRYRSSPAPEPSESKVLARLATVESGLYGVSYASIFGSRGQGIATSELRLSRQGESVAYHLEPSGSVFGRGSVLYFVSEGAAINPYGLEAVVELEVGVSGDVMGEDATVPSGGGMSYYFHREESEENHFYATSFATPLWLWETLLSGMSGSYGFEVSELALTPASGEVEVWLKGVSRVEEFYPPRVRLSINGVVVAEEEWGSEELYRMRAEVPSGVLQSGTNTLLVENVSTSDYTAVMLDRFAVSYPRRVIAESGVLRGTWSESGKAEVSGVEGGSFVVDVTEPKPLWLTETVPVVGGVAFHASSEREYLVVSPGSVLSPEIRHSSTSQLKHKSQQADYLVLAPKEFLRASIPLLRLRRGQGLRSKAVSLEEVYREFGHGESSPEAIRDFLAYAYHEWASPSVRYVVLLGDGTYDFKDYLGTGVANPVPPRLEKTSFMWTASDSWYGRVNGEDVLADISIGRLPASMVEEAHGMVAKIVAYETSDQSLEGSVVLVTDDPDPGGDFEGDAEELAGGILLSRSPRKIYLGDLGVSSTKSAIVQAFDEGASLMSYIGHGSITFWAKENVFDGESISGLRPQQEQPLVLTMNCLNGFFHYPYLDALAEELIKAEDKGAVAVVSPSGLSLNGPAHRFHRALLEELVSGEHATLGDAMLAAQSRYADRGEFLELLTIFHVFGDPALKLQR